MVRVDGTLIPHFFNSYAEAIPVVTLRKLVAHNLAAILVYPPKPEEIQVASPIENIPVPVITETVDLPIPPEHTD